MYFVIKYLTKIKYRIDTIHIIKHFFIKKYANKKLSIQTKKNS